MSVLDELASPHGALPGGSAPARAPPPMGAWDFVRMGMPPAALQQLISPASGLMAQQVRPRGPLFLITEGQRRRAGT